MLRIKLNTTWMSRSLRVRAGAPAGAPGSACRTRRSELRLSRRGVASILAMMFLVMFGALSVAMAVASQGNLRTAETHTHVVRAMGAAETGLEIARNQLKSAISRFVVEKGVVDAGFGRRLWTGTMRSEDGRITVLSARNGVIDAVSVRGIADALVSAHRADQNIVAASGFPTEAGTFSPTNVDAAEFETTNWVRTGLTALDGDMRVRGTLASAYQITYAPLANGTDIRIIVTGYSSIGVDGSGYLYRATADDQQARAVTRTIQQDIRVAKRPQHAMLSPSRIMVGKNVVINGNLGARYIDVSRQNGDPVLTKGDFDGLDASLTAKITRFRTSTRQYDVDGDNRLRVAHTVESQGLPGASELTSRNWPATTFRDATRDGYVDEFDIFINHYDTNNDGELVLPASLSAGTPAAGRPSEFTADLDLALLIDNGNPDRNRNGVSGFADANDNNRLTPASAMLDANDRVLGWRDGVINGKDQYAKLRGRMMFRTSAAAWASARGGSYASQLQGPIVAPTGQTPTRFGATDDELPAIDESSFSNAAGSLKNIADGASFSQQVATQLGVSSASLASYEQAVHTGSGPRFYRADLDPATVYSQTGMQIWEAMPFNSPTASDYYYRPRYINMTFKNVQIPTGTNALFINCKFIGVTFVRSYTDNTHVNWSLYGQMEWSASSGRPIAKVNPLDKSDFLRYTSGNVTDGPANYASFPDPPVINGTIQTGTNRDTKRYSNNIRFHNCLFVGSIVSDTPTQFTNIRNKLQFTGSTRFTTVNPDEPNNTAVNPDSDDLAEISKSSMLLPNYSVDVGTFNAPTDTFSGTSSTTAQNVQLSGTIVAGVLDIRGSARVDGALFMTYNPVFGQGPMLQQGQAVGNPANFNVTLGYFGSGDGDGESTDPNSLPVVGGQRIVGYDTNGDGIPDVSSSQAQPPGSTPIPFYGYGRVEVNYNPNIPMPDGIMLPLSGVDLLMSYREGVH
ncbi:MAG: hypothetical protein K2W85_04965 [Phycisphaerales bacterium]|nr:hypothetical protein [Phycisphaerales bacterium]